MAGGCSAPTLPEPAQIALRPAPGHRAADAGNGGKVSGAASTIWDSWLPSTARPTPASFRKTPGQPDRVSTSDTLDASFHPGSGIDSIVQQGNIAYVDGERKAWGDHAIYTPADQMLVLNGSPRVVDGGMTTTSRTMRLNRATGDAFAEGDVKSTYSDLKAQPNGALLAASDPIHVTARAMTAHSSPAVALYTGEARLWQNANVIQAPSIEFDRNRRSVVAQGTPVQPVSTVLVQTEKSGKVTPVKITSARLSYTDSERKAHFEGGVQAQGAELTITARKDGCFPAAARPSRYESVAYRDGQDRPHPCRRAGSHHPTGSQGDGRSAGLYHCRRQVCADGRFA